MSKSKQVFACLQFPADLVTFTEEILNGKLHFLCNVSCHSTKRSPWKVPENSQGKNLWGSLIKLTSTLLKNILEKVFSCGFYKILGTATFCFNNEMAISLVKHFSINLHYITTTQKQSHEVFYKKGVLKNLTKFTGAGVSFLTKLHAAGLQQY